MSKQIQTQLIDGVLKIAISGSINENTDFTHLELSGAKEIHIDLEQVKSLNSMGLRNWVIWVKTLKGRAQIRFSNCPRGVVEQMGILQGFLPIGAVVDSFQLPYYCESCGHEETVLAVRGRDYMEATADSPEGIKLPLEKPCPQCQRTLAVDVTPAKYFSFLKNRRV